MYFISYISLGIQEVKYFIADKKINFFKHKVGNLRLITNFLSNVWCLQGQAKHWETMDYSRYYALFQSILQAFQANIYIYNIYVSYLQSYDVVELKTLVFVMISEKCCKVNIKHNFHNSQFFFFIQTTVNCYCCLT